MAFNTEAVKAVKARVNLKLVGLDGNAFFLLGTFKRAALKQGWEPGEVKAVMTEATSGDYDHLLQTMLHFSAE
jgi:hypothetical protein